jgi:ribose transport system substrate-binding protein
MAGLVLFAISCQKVAKTEAASKTGGADMRIVIISKVAHTWFGGFANCARIKVAEIGVQIGRNIAIDCRAPASCDVVERNSIIQQAASRSTGIVIDPLDYNGTAAVIKESHRQGSPVVFFDAEAPDGFGVPQRGGHSEDHAWIATEYLPKAIDCDRKNLTKARHWIILKNWNKCCHVEQI